MNEKVLTEKNRERKEKLIGGVILFIQMVQCNIKLGKFAGVKTEFPSDTSDEVSSKLSI